MHPRGGFRPKDGTPCRRVRGRGVLGTYESLGSRLEKRGPHSSDPPLYPFTFPNLRLDFCPNLPKGLNLLFAIVWVIPFTHVPGPLGHS